MILEYVLLLTVFVMLFFSTLMKSGGIALTKAGPLLGARVERNLVTGGQFKNKQGNREPWVKP